MDLRVWCQLLNPLIHNIFVCVYTYPNGIPIALKQSY
jgi:hypothetical protein